ncbi:MAG: polysaccharide biosynthesis C-terminal domain-containing protein, partial [Bacilli bacterium]|nr:polysaccharide biosynthesis C-terminal domain-containing protein [Bacilli bacterium]
IVTMCVLANPICGLISGTYDFTFGNGYWSAPYILMILSSMMLTYSIGDIIYGQILLPMKKEKYYLLAIGVGTLLNIALSIILGGFVFKDRPAIGVAIGTASTDLLIIIFLMAISWKWVKHAIFNKNSLKLLIANAIILAVSLLIYNPLMKLWGVLNLSTSVSFVLQLFSVVLIDGIIYIVTLLLLKEDLVSSFRRNRKEINNA